MNFLQAWRNLVKMLRVTLGGKLGKKSFIKMSGGLYSIIPFAKKSKLLDSYTLLNFSNLARIERSAQKQAKSGTENAGWYEKW